MDATDAFEPFIYGKGIASGDINGDHRPDLVVAYERGVFVYQNLGDLRFKQVATLIPAKDFNAFVVKLADYNNDGQVDLLTSGYDGSIYIYYQIGAGQFATMPVKIPASSTRSPGSRPP